MDDLKTIGEIIKYVVGGIVTAILWWDKIYKPSQEKKVVEEKKANGTFVTWESIKNKIDRIGDHLKYLEDKVSTHLEKEAREDIMFEAVRKDQEFLKERFNSLKEMFDKLEIGQQKNLEIILEIKTQFSRP